MIVPLKHIKAPFIYIYFLKMYDEFLTKTPLQPHLLRSDLMIFPVKPNYSPIFLAKIWLFSH